MNRRQFVAHSLLAGGVVGYRPIAAAGAVPASAPVSGVDGLDVRAYGAVGDGHSDDTDALQQAVDEGGGAVVLSRGTYRIVRPIVIDLSQGYRGMVGQAGTARLVMTGPGPALRIVGHHDGTAEPSTVQAGVWAHERMPIVSGFEILGEHAEADGIELLRTMQTVVCSMLIRNCRHGLHLIERNRNFLLSGSHIYQCSETGVFFDRVNLHQANVYGNHISYNRRAGIRQLEGDVHNVQIVGNDIEYNAGSDMPSADVLLEAMEGIVSEYTIASNTIQAKRYNPGANIRIVGQPTKPPAGIRLIAITGNVLGDRDHNIEVAHGGRITMTGNTIYNGTARNVQLSHCRFVVVSANTFVSALDRQQNDLTNGLTLEDCSSCSVVGNVLDRCGRSGDHPAASIALRRCQQVHVTSCQVTDPLYQGVALEKTVCCKVSDNIIRDGREARVMASAIAVSGASRDNVIDNNAVTQGTHAAIVCDPSQGNVVNNTIWA